MIDMNDNNSAHSDYGTIWIKKETKRRFYSHGTKGETSDSLLNRLLDEIEERL